MNKFYSYILPAVVLAISHTAAIYFDNEFILYCGWIISLIWLNRVAHSYQNKVVKILTVILFVITILWTIGLLMWASAW